VNLDPGRIHIRFVFTFAHVGVKGDDSVKNKDGVVPRITAQHFTVIPGLFFGTLSKPMVCSNMIADFDVMGVSSLFSSARFVFSSAIILRAVLLVYGHVQDQYSPLKYTDIDYYVFTDADTCLEGGLLTQEIHTGTHPF